MVFTLKSIYQDLLSKVDEIDARFIIEERTRFDISDITTNPDSPISDSEHQQITMDVAQRLSGKPLSRIFGWREFWGLPFELSEDTLDPRPDTERIIEIALERFPDKQRPIDILDMGTGSGCILISLLKEFPNATGLGTDISDGALNMAIKNAKKNGVENRCSFKKSDWTESVEKKYDLVVSNPPYISNQIIPTLSSEVQNHDPILALDGGMDGLVPYKNIFLHMHRILKRDGIGLFEIGYDQKEDVMRLAEKARLVLRGVHVDYSGNPRVVEISCGDK